MGVNGTTVQGYFGTDNLLSHYKRYVDYHKEFKRCNMGSRILVALPPC